MALTVSPFGTYADVTGVVNATAAAEIVALITELKTFLPSDPSAFAAGAGTPVGAASEAAMPHPEFDDISLHAAEKLIGEIDALAAAIAAAPTA
jgi:hypothetical protein